MNINDKENRNQVWSCVRASRGRRLNEHITVLLCVSAVYNAIKWPNKTSITFSDTDRPFFECLPVSSKTIFWLSFKHLFWLNRGVWSSHLIFYYFSIIFNHIFISVADLTINTSLSLSLLESTERCMMPVPAQPASSPRCEVSLARDWASVTNGRQKPK